MSRWRWLAALVVVLALGGGGLYASRRLDERQARRRYAEELMCCLTGADPVTPAEATAVAARMPSHQSGELSACVAALEDAPRLSLHKLSPELPDRIATLLEGNPKEHIPHLESLYSVLGKLAIEPRDDCAERPMRTEITNVAAARERVGKPLWSPSAGERFERERLIFVGAEPRLVVEPRGDRPLAQARWTEEPFRSHWPVRVERDGTLRRGEAKLAFHNDGPKPFAATARWMLARDGKTLVGRRLVAGDAIVDDAPVTVTSPFNLDRVKAQSCALPDGDLLALVDHRQHRVTILEATDELRLWGSYAPGRTPPGGARSGPSLVCDAGSVTLTWATSEPALAGTFPPRAVKGATFPPGPHPQVVSRIVCRPEGCGSPKEQRLRDLPALWRSEGGYSSPYFLAAVDVEPLGDRVLLWWERGGGLYARVGAVGELDGAPLRRILDLAHPRGEEPFVPSAINWPQLSSIARAGVALLILTEDKRRSTQPAASFLLRFDPSGEAQLLLPRAPPPH